MCSLDITLLAFALLHPVLHGQICLLLQVSLDFLLLHSSPLCCKEQYCIGTWNIRSMNQGKLDVVKQEMARMNVDILGISELNKMDWNG